MMSPRSFKHPGVRTTRAAAAAPAVLLAALLMALASAGEALAGEVSYADGAISFSSRSSQANRVAVTYDAAGGTQTVTLTDVVPIRNDAGAGCSYPNAADRRTLRCTSGGSFFDGAVDLGPGNDTVVVTTRGGAASANRITDGAGNDSVTIDAGTNSWFNGPGNDTYRGGRGVDTARPGVGDDRIYGGAGSDALSGGLGNDVLFGGVGLDRMFGGPGTDHIDGLIRDFARR